MEFSPLQPILDVDVAARAGRLPLDLAAAFLDGGAQWFQLRAKQMAAGPLLQLAEACVRRAEPYRARVIVNDRTELAALSGAAGVHVGQDDLPPAAVRRLLGDRAIVGLSTHTREQVEAALIEPVSYIAVGPVFGTATKETGYHAVGLATVRMAAAMAGGTPLVAIGGITLENAPSVIAAGATSVAVITDLLAGDDPAGRVRAYLQRCVVHRV